MKYILITLVVLSGFLIFSCKSDTTEIQCQRIDSLFNISSNFQSRLDSISDDSIAVYYSNIMHFNNVLVEKLHGMPESKEMKEKLLKMGSVEKGFKKIPDKLLNFKNEIRYSVEQLKALKKDVIGGLLKDNEFDTYFNDELKAIETISPELENILNVINKHLTNYKTLLPDVKFYVDSLANS